MGKHAVLKFNLLTTTNRRLRQYAWQRVFYTRAMGTGVFPFYCAPKLVVEAEVRSQAVPPAVAPLVTPTLANNGLHRYLARSPSARPHLLMRKASCLKQPHQRRHHVLGYDGSRGLYCCRR